MTYKHTLTTPGIRPAWLNGEATRIKLYSGEGWQTMEHHARADEAHWYGVHTIELPTSHWAIAPLAAGFEPWAGGDDAPDTWDGGTCMLRDARVVQATDWTWRREMSMYDIIGYHNRTAAHPTQRSPTDADMMEAHRCTVIRECIDALPGRDGDSSRARLRKLLPPDEREQVARFLCVAANPGADPSEYMSNATLAEKYLRMADYVIARERTAQRKDV